MMNPDAKLPHGTASWFEMVGTVMAEAALNAALSSHHQVSFVERYTDGVELSKDLVQGLRFEINEGTPSFRVGARRHEHADVTVEITSSAARKLNALHSADPAYLTARDELLRSGEMRVVGDPSRMGAWLDTVHDPIVDRTS
jgi:hypothetical protein